MMAHATDVHAAPDKTGGDCYLRTLNRIRAGALCVAAGLASVDDALPVMARHGVALQDELYARLPVRRLTKVGPVLQSVNDRHAMADDHPGAGLFVPHALGVHVGDVQAGGHAPTLTSAGQLRSYPHSGNDGSNADKQGSQRHPQCEPGGSALPLGHLGLPVGQTKCVARDLHLFTADGDLLLVVRDVLLPACILAVTLLLLRRRDRVCRLLHLPVEVIVRSPDEVA